ncbi:MAG: TPM domain-containing protein [Clostridia bacterium]|nr:TPM domain-containing protein [Clostridia bacterium]
MMKRILPLLLALVFCLSLSLSTPAYDAAPTLVYDEAGVLSGTREKELNQRLRDLKTTVVIAFTDDIIQESEAEARAKKLFDSLTYGTSNGVIFYVSVNSRKYNLQGIGTMYDRLNSDAMDLLEGRVVPSLKNDRFEEAASEFVSALEEILDATADGSDYTSPLPWKNYVFYSLIIGLVIAGIAVLSMAAQLKSVRRQHAARSYEKQGSFSLTRQSDLFLYRTLSRVPRPKNNSSGGGGRSSGGGSRSGSF